jgi:competence protein CoiA
MKFALVEGERREAKPGLSGKCPVYGHAMIAKCGEHRVHHWAHQANCTCDHWWKPETEWHRDWKNQLPEDWQEIVHQSQSEDGEKHISDVLVRFDMDGINIKSHAIFACSNSLCWMVGKNVSGV